MSESLLYKWRFKIGYFLIIAALIAALLLVGLYLPGGISSQEMQSVADSNSTSWMSIMTSSDVVNLPYRLLQHLCISLFGVSTFVIKLPSLFLALLSAVGIIFILRRWFKPSVGILASLIAVTTGQFLFIAQDGTANILYLFWPVCLLLLATLTSFGKNLKWFYVLGFFVVSGLSLYTPLSIYLLIAMVAVVLLHPHLRYIIKLTPRLAMIGGVVLFAIIVTPLVNNLINSPGIAGTLMGIPSTTINFKANLTSLGAVYFGFLRPGGMTIMTPFFELGSMLLIVIGMYHVIKTRVTAKNYIIIAWIIFLIPIIIINTSAITITFLPLVLLLSSGLSATLNYWYRLFPSNPYARIGGLIPIIVLVSVLIYSGASRFVFGYQYDPDIVTNFSNDIVLIPKDTTKILVSSNEKKFYNAIAEHNGNVEIISEPIGDQFLATRKSKENYLNYRIERIITSALKDDSDRFYLYKKIAK